MIARAILALAATMALAGCGAPMFRPPAGPGLPAPDAPAAWQEATKTCSGARSFVAALRVSGRTADDRFPTISVDAAVTDQGSIYLSATHTGRSLFLLAGGAERATLWLREDNRAVTDAPAAIIDAMLGVGLSPARLLAVLTGCAARSLDVKQAERFGRLLRVETPDAVVYLEQQHGAWQTRAAQVDGFTVQYDRDGTSVPQRIVITADPGRPPARLDVRVSQAELNRELEARFFTPPAGAAAADPMSIDELRRARRGGGN